MIYKKLLELQKLDIKAVKDGTNDYFKVNGKSSTFPTLNGLLEKIKKPLNDVGIVIIHEATENGLLTKLVDTEDDTQVSSFMPWVGADNAQKLLACSTYYRRGTLIALLGLEAEDDDGNTASAPTKHKTTHKSVQDVQGEPFPSEKKEKSADQVADDISLEALEY